jgi:Domain of unknown function DUF1829/Domain of unknown function DUF1828
MSWLDIFIDDYYKWLRKKTIIRDTGSSSWVLIDTPFTNMYNDTIELYAKKEGDKITLSDNGDTFSNLELSGISFERSSFRRSLMQNILRNYGVLLNGTQLFTSATQKNFSQRKYNILTAIMELNDLYVMSKHKVASIFKEDVRKYLDSKEIIYTPDFISKGSTGLEFTFDFQIAKKEREIVIKSFNSINQTYLASFLFKWDDIKPVRENITKKEVQAIAIINDENKNINSDYLDALSSKNADCILWSQRFTKESDAKVA